MTKICCVRGRHYSNTVNQNVIEKVNPKNKNLVKIIKGKGSVCGRNKSQILLSK